MNKDTKLERRQEYIRIHNLDVKNKSFDSNSLEKMTNCSCNVCKNETSILSVDESMTVADDYNLVVCTNQGCALENTILLVSHT